MTDPRTIASKACSAPTFAPPLGFAHLSPIPTMQVSSFSAPSIPTNLSIDRFFFFHIDRVPNPPCLISQTLSFPYLSRMATTIYQVHRRRRVSGRSTSQLAPQLSLLRLLFSRPLSATAQQRRQVQANGSDGSTWGSSRWSHGFTGREYGWHHARLPVRYVLVKLERLIYSSHVPRSAIACRSTGAARARSPTPEASHSYSSRC